MRAIERYFRKRYKLFANTQRQESTKGREGQQGRKTERKEEILEYSRNSGKLGRGNEAEKD